MNFTEEQIQDFTKLYLLSYNKKLKRKDAIEKATRLVLLVKALSKEL